MYDKAKVDISSSLMFICVKSSSTKTGEKTVDTEMIIDTSDTEGTPENFGGLLSEYLNETAEIPRLTQPQEEELSGRAKNGDGHAFARLVECNIGLVRRVAQRHTGCGLDFDDLVQEGIFGLMHAIETFDPNHNREETGKKICFSTHATWWIRSRMGKAIDEMSRTVRIPPVSDRKKITRYKPFYKRSHIVGGHEAAMREAVRTLGTSFQEAERAFILLGLKNTSSLNTPLAGDPSFTALDVLEDQGAKPYDEQLHEEHTLSSLRKWLSELPEEERSPLSRLFGLNGYPEHTLKEVAKACGITVDQVRRTKSRALKKLQLIALQNGYSSANIFWE